MDSAPQIHKVRYCYYCHDPLQPQFGKYVPGGKKHTKDHVIAEYRGGNSRRINLVDCCSDCNGLKGSHLPVEFAEVILDRIARAKFNKQFPVGKLQLMYSNVQRLIVEVVNVHGNALYRTADQPKTKKLKEIVDEVMKKPKKPKVMKPRTSLVGSYLDRHAGDICLSVNNNTRRTQPKEEVLQLQSQTVEEFRYKKRLDEIVKEQLSLPEPDFHDHSI